MRLALTTLALAAAVLFSTSAQAQDTAAPEDIQQRQPTFFVRADVDRATRQYREGDYLTIRASCEVDAYLYVIYQQADGKMYQVFPNSAQKNNQVKAFQAVQIPAKGDLFRWKVEAPFGKETIKVIASKEPIEPLSVASMTKGRANALSAKQLKAIEIEIEGETPPQEWGEDQIEITTYAANQELEASRKKRYGLFFGVSLHKFNAEMQNPETGQGGLDVDSPAPSARKVARIMGEVGQLDDYKVYTNEHATGQQLDEAITKWLPSVSKPGDTVVIYFCGHGGQHLDLNKDEADGMDECLLPNDFVSVGAFNTLLKRKEAGTLPAYQAPLVDALLGPVQQAVSQGRTEEEKLLLADTALCNLTGITDDLFAKWLQKLSNRQIVVILETCHSGGFATGERRASELGGAKFDFLAEETVRLKDLGQKDMAVMTACAADVTAAAKRLTDEEFEGAVSSEPPMAVMSYALTKGLLASQGAWELEEAFAYCQNDMKQYFERLNAILRANGKEELKANAPILYNQLTRKAYLKP